MSAILDEIIAARKQKAIAYEDYLKKIAAIAQQVNAGKADDTPIQLSTPGRLALYNNLLNKPKSAQTKVAETSASYASTPASEILELALNIDKTIKQMRPDNWRGNQAKERQIKNALYEILNDVDETVRIFNIIEQQPEY